MKPLAEALTRIQFAHNGVLSSSATAYDGHPFGSIVPYAIADDSALVFSVSTISEHFKNIQADNRISVLIADPFGEHAPQRYSRSTVMGAADILDGATANSYRDAYLKRFPDSAAKELAHDFVYIRLIPQTIRWILGFGSMGWATEEWRSFELDPIALQGIRIVEHMNFDHTDSLPVLAQVAGEAVSSGEQVRMVFVCATFCELQIRSESQSRRCQIQFSKFCESSSAVRKEIIALLGTAQH
jgi:putative heme iron utilization protein